jgi:hypothetical protein
MVRALLGVALRRAAFATGRRTAFLLAFGTALLADLAFGLRVDLRATVFTAFDFNAVLFLAAIVPSPGREAPMLVRFSGQ